MYYLGHDIGSSSVKAALVEASQNEVIATASYPDNGLPINSPKPGWAEQDPNEWWRCVIEVTKLLLNKSAIDKNEVLSIGIAYQMHGMVALDKDLQVVRPSIIWCDSRAIETGSSILSKVDRETCFRNLLNLPGNFTFSKLLWMKQNEPENYKMTRWVMLPGDFIAMKMTNNITITPSGLSEGTMWDFDQENVASFLFEYTGIDQKLIPEIKPTFSDQGNLCEEAATALGLSTKVRVGYRAGDQPNNALSLGAINPGDIAATGGTSGVIYAVDATNIVDKKSRVNSFAHVNNTGFDKRIGVLLCINGTGIQYRWIKEITDSTSYENMEEELSKIPAGSEGVTVLPFGNGAERMFNNKIVSGNIFGLDFNRHSKSHLHRASLEGIAFSFQYGIEILKELGINIKKIRVGNDNLFRSQTFSQMLSDLSGFPIEIVETTGAIGAARGGAYGLGYFETLESAVGDVPIIKEYQPGQQNRKEACAFYERWKSHLELLINDNHEY